MKNPAVELVALIEKSPGLVVVANARGVLMDSARPSKGRSAYLKIAVPDEVAVSLRGDPDKAQHEVYFAVVPREARERLESRIILP